MAHIYDLNPHLAPPGWGKKKEEPKKEEPKTEQPKKKGRPKKNEQANNT